MCFSVQRKAYEQTLKAAAVTKEVGPPSSCMHLLYEEADNIRREAEENTFIWAFLYLNLMCGLIKV